MSNPFSQFVSQAQFYSQLKLSLSSDPIALAVPTSILSGLVKIQCARHFPDLLRNILLALALALALALEPSEMYDLTIKVVILDVR